GGPTRVPRCRSPDRSGNRSSSPRGRRPRRRFRASWFAQGPGATYNVYETVGESIERLRDPRGTGVAREHYPKPAGRVNPNKATIVATDPASPIASRRPAAI